MKKVIVYWEIAGFLFVSALGTLLHFVFECTGGHIAAALFSAVNESVWEHMKLLFYPMFLFAIIERMAWGKAYENFWYIKLMGILRGMILIPVIYYTYTGILGTSYDWFNIAIFFIAAGAAYLWEAKGFGNESVCRKYSSVPFLCLCAIVLIFTVMTFVPVHIPLFRDPSSGGYGWSSVTF